MGLPKINHNLLDSSLTIQDKIKYMKARCLLSACLHAESGSCVFDKEPEAIKTINKLNNYYGEKIND